MQIIEGFLKGTMVPYKEQKWTRVTSEKVRKAVFDVLKGFVDFEDLKVADLFCGSGMYGLEAMSRGAKEVVFVDEDKGVAKTLKENLKKLKVESYKVENRKVENFIVHYGSTQEHGANSFDLVFADPPYYDFDFAKLNDVYKILNDPSSPRLRRTSGIFVLEQSKRGGAKELKGLELFLEKKYGDTSVRFYRTMSNI